MRIGFFGATGSWDFGDYAMLIHNIQEFRQRNVVCDYTIFSIDPNITRENLCNNKLRNIKIVWDKVVRFFFCYRVMKKIASFFALGGEFEDFWYGFLYRLAKKNIWLLVDQELFMEIKNLDVCIFNGGGYLQFGWGHHNIRFMIELLACKFFGKKVFFLGSSVGPMQKYDIYIKETLRLADGIMLRDGRNYSWKLLEEYGIVNMICGPDDLINVYDFYNVKKQDKGYAIIEIMAWIDNAVKGGGYIITILAQFCNYLYRNCNLDIVLVNFDKGDKRAYEIIDSVCSELDEKVCVKKYYSIDSMYSMFSLYAGASFSLSFKYHPVILSLGIEVPCLAIITDYTGYYEGKIKGAFSNCDMDIDKHVMHINDTSYDNLVNMYKKSCSEEVPRDRITRLCNIKSDYVEYILNSVK